MAAKLRRQEAHDGQRRCQKGSGGEGHDGESLPVTHKLQRLGIPTTPFSLLSGSEEVTNRWIVDYKPGTHRGDPRYGKALTFGRVTPTIAP